MTRTMPSGRLEPDTCSVTSLARADPLVGTAVPQSRWLLVEQPGPWGRAGITASRFDPASVHALVARAAAEGVRIMLVRRPGRSAPPEEGLRWGYADSRLPGRGLWWQTRRSDSEIVDAPWDGSVGTLSDRPTYLVCAHAGRDVCCAVLGRPLAAALPVPDPLDVWECSHTGGDRFAANLLTLPYGDLYGRVSGDGADIVAATVRGEVLLENYRGRTGEPPAVQVALTDARSRLGLLGLDDLEVLGVTDDGDDHVTVALSAAGARLSVGVQRRTSAEPALLTCHAAGPAHWFTWTVDA